MHPTSTRTGPAWCRAILIFLLTTLVVHASALGSLAVSELGQSWSVRSAIRLAAPLQTEDLDEISYTASQMIWKRVGNLPAFWTTHFEFSADGTLWTYLGEGTLAGNEWVIEGVTNLGDGVVRARGYLTSANGEPSSLFTEKRFEYSDDEPLILSNRQSPTVTSGGVSFQISGKPGQWVVVESSQDLVAWKAFPAKRLNGDTTWFSDVQAHNWAHRFYRVHRLP